MGKWLSKAAVLWALDEAPGVPDRLVSTLVAVARFADEAGRGAHPSAQTVAYCTRKSRRQARRDLDELEALGLLLPGDQRIVASIRADRRPFVYDLPMPRGVKGDPSQNGHGGTPQALRGDTSPLNGGTHVTPEEFLKNSGRRARASAAAQSPPASQYRAPPCPECGKPFSQETLADPSKRGMALEGSLLCSPECGEADNLRYLRSASIRQLIEDGSVAAAIEAGIRQPGDFPAHIAANCGYPS